MYFKHAIHPSDLMPTITKKNLGYDTDNAAAFGFTFIPKLIIQN